MSTRDFRAMLDARSASGHTVCVGLDSLLERLPAFARRAGDPQASFNADIIDATADLAAAYKPNAAFYEARGTAGIEALISTVRYAHEAAPEVPVIVDAKRGDIGTTNDGYAQFLFDVIGADAITVHPYLGAEAAGAFLERSEKGIYVLCRTSNPGARELQDLQVAYDGAQVPLYEAVAHNVDRLWNANRNCGLVVGATYPRELGEIRNLVPDLPLLIPGVGAQGADVQDIVAAFGAQAGAPVLINSSRGIIFADDGPEYPQKARQATAALDADVRRIRAG